MKNFFENNGQRIWLQESTDDILFIWTNMNIDDKFCLDKWISYLVEILMLWAVFCYFEYSDMEYAKYGRNSGVSFSTLGFGNWLCYSVSKLFPRLLREVTFQLYVI
jgi:hypothetical protein